MSTTAKPHDILHIPHDVVWKRTERQLCITYHKRWNIIQYAQISYNSVQMKNTFINSKLTNKKKNWLHNNISHDTAVRESKVYNMPRKSVYYYFAFICLIRYCTLISNCATVTSEYQESKPINTSQH